jgi:tetratricopeptide (TPR) repeat protein
VSVWSDLFGLLSFLPDSQQIQKAIRDWWAEPLNQHIWELVEVLVYIVAAWELLRHLYRWIFRRRSRLELKLELAEEETREYAEEIRELRSEKQRLSTELEEVRGRLPQAAISRADREWRDRNTLAAVRQLETWFEENAESIAAIALHLAKFHISRAVPDPGNHLDRARDLLRLARGASPTSREAQELSSELDTVNAGLQEQLIHDGDVQIAWNSAMAPRLGAQGEALLPAVNACREIAQFYFEKGMWRLTPIFADRAADLALSGGGVLRRVWFSVETRAAAYQVLVGRAADGLQRLDHVLAEAREALPARNVIVLGARYYRALALERLGCFADAFTEINAFAQTEAEIKGAGHPDTLKTRYLRASVLMYLGRYEDAFTEIEHLVPVVAETQGARHPDTLMTRRLRACVLQRLGRIEDALVEIGDFAPVEVEVRGACAPETLTTRYWRASVLYDLGRYGEALTEIDDLAPVMAEVKGARHPDMLATRGMRASVLSDLGRYGEALTEIDDLAPVMAEVQGSRHPQTLTTRYLRAFVLSDCGRYGEALTQIDDFAPVQAEVSGARHPDTRATRYLHAICLANLGRWDEALSELEPLYETRAETLGASHIATVLTRSTCMGIEIAAMCDVDPSELREVIRILTAATGPRSRWSLLARYRLSRLLLQRGDAEQARTEIVDTIAQFDPMTDPGHSLLRSATALLDAIEGHPTKSALIV